MRALAFALFICTFLSIPMTPTVVAADLPAGMESPGAVAISEGSPGKWIFRSFPGFLPLYVFDGDRPGKSTCDDVCVAVWPVLRAEDDAKPMGRWTIIARADGRKQWAYKDHPVYTFYQDTPNNPKGVGMEENWYYEDLAGGVKAVGEKVAARSTGKKAAWRLLEP